MAEDTDQLQKLISIASDKEISRELRSRAIIQLGSIGSHAALVALLNLVADETAIWEERMLALRQAEKTLKPPPRPWWHYFRTRRQD
jgi:HEAT repeat protein